MKETSAQQVASRIRFEVVTYAGFPASATGVAPTLRDEATRVPCTSCPAMRYELPSSIDPQTASRRAGASIRLLRSVRTAGMVVAAPMPMSVSAMARRRASGIRFATSKPTPKASAARVATRNPNCDGRRTRFMCEISAARVSNSRAGSFARFLHHHETTLGRAPWVFRLISPGR